MNKFAKRLMTGVLAGALATSMALPAFAAQDTSVSVSGLAKDDVVSYYKIVSQKADGTWELNGSYTGITVTDVTDGEISSDDAAKLLDGTLPAKAGADVTIGTDGIWTLNDAAVGTYLVLVKSANGNVMYNPVFVSADYEAGNNSINVATGTPNYGVPKKSTIGVEKTADKKDVKAGDKVSFTIESTIPAFSAKYTKPYYAISDTLSGSLKLDADSIKVQAGGTEVAASNYTPDTKDKEFTLTFKENYLKSITSNTTVVVSYTATVGAANEFTDNVTRMHNEAKVEFSNNPSSDSDHGTVTDNTEHYTFGLDANIAGSDQTATENNSEEIAKIGLDEAGNPIHDTTVTKTYTYNEKEVSPLNGAKFELKDANGSVVAQPESDANGHLTVTGLASGTYTLKETTAPSGYVTSDTEYTITITPVYNTDSDEKTLDSYTVTTSWTDRAGNQQSATSTFEVTNENNVTKITATKTNTSVTALVENVKAASLPTTGGMGTTIFYIAGIVLVGGAAILLVTRRRMSAR